MEQTNTKETNICDIILSCGRHHLFVAGFVVATEGDLCRDPNFGRKWTPDDFREIQKEILTATPIKPHTALPHISY